MPFEYYIAASLLTLFLGMVAAAKLIRPQYSRQLRVDAFERLSYLVFMSLGVFFFASMTVGYLDLALHHTKSVPAHVTGLIASGLSFVLGMCIFNILLALSNYLPALTTAGRKSIIAQLTSDNTAFENELRELHEGLKEREQKAVEAARAKYTAECARYEGYLKINDKRIANYQSS